MFKLIFILLKSSVDLLRKYGRIIFLNVEVHQHKLLVIKDIIRENEGAELCL